jgi:carbonic anhydrase
VCSSGNLQSPINLGVQNIKIGDAKVALLCELSNINSPNTRFTINAPANDYAIKVETSNCDLYMRNNAFEFRYSLVDFTIHMPSEHTINNLRYDGEIQLYFHLQDVFCSQTKDHIVALSVPFMDSGISVPDTPTLLTNISSLVNTSSEINVLNNANVRRDLMGQLGSN